LIYAGAQKNLGPAGLTVVIVREDLTGHARPGTPSIWDYQAVAAEGSLLNTPPTFAWYVAGLVLKWLAGEGGLAGTGDRNRAKGQRVCEPSDAPGSCANPVGRHCRWGMNVPFTLADPNLDAASRAEARAAGLTNLEGPRSVGGIRASLYNAMPPEGVA